MAAPLAPAALDPLEAVEDLAAPLVRAQQLVAGADDADVRVALGLRGADEAGCAQRLDDRDEVLLVPQPRHLLAVHVLAPLLDGAEAPRLHALGEAAEVPRV